MMKRELGRISHSIEQIMKSLDCARPPGASESHIVGVRAPTLQPVDGAKSSGTNTGRRAESKEEELAASGYILS